MQTIIYTSRRCHTDRQVGIVFVSWLVGIAGTAEERESEMGSAARNGFLLPNPPDYS